ncbi:MAG: adenylyl-sulfate kinase, partial [Bradyrhizobium sp.]|uniref:adenylyl-sulfate kinase n=1 Tax=Bradyrhizobium sp. TaxID=376 RepID=UPI001DDD3EB3
MASDPAKQSDDTSDPACHDHQDSRTAAGPLGATYWITGLPGAGKTTIARLLWTKLRSEGLPAILIDGDRMRNILGDRFGYSREEREQLAGIYGRWCLELNRQGTDAVCATVSMFE